MQFSRQEYWYRLPFSTPGIFPPQGLNPHLLCLLHCTWVLSPLSYQGSLCKIPKTRGWILLSSLVMLYGMVDCKMERFFQVACLIHFSLLKAEGFLHGSRRGNQRFKAPEGCDGHLLMWRWRRTPDKDYWWFLGAEISPLVDSQQRTWKLS